MADAVRCRRCSRALLSDWQEVGLGPVCAARLGLVRRPKLRLPAPRPVPHPPGQPDLLDLLDELNSEGEWRP